MQTNERTRYMTRDRILEMLSDDEVANVRAAESAARLGDGDEYLDLEALEQGVRRSPRKDTLMGRILPRKAVQDETWNRILSELAGPPSQRALLEGE